MVPMNSTFLVALVASIDDDRPNARKEVEASTLVADLIRSARRHLTTFDIDANGRFRQGRGDRRALRKTNSPGAKRFLGERLFQHCSPPFE